MNIHDQEETCILCRRAAEKGDKYYVRTDVKTNITELLRKIPRYLEHLFDFLPSNSTNSLLCTFPFCCRLCKKQIEKRQRLVDSIITVENDLRSRRFLDRNSSRRLSFGEEANAASEIFSSPMPTSTSRPNKFDCDISPIAVRQPTTCTSSVLEQDDSNPRNKQKDDTKETPHKELGVKVQVTWPSQTKARKLKAELEPLGRCLLQGTWLDIARAAFKVKELRTEFFKLFLREISKECSDIVSAKNPSLLRKTSASEMQELSLEKVCSELETRTPLLYSVLITAAIPVPSKKQGLNAQKWLPSVAVAGSVLLKQRSRNMNAVQLMITTLIKYTGFHAMCNFLSALRVGVSPSFHNKKSDEFGILYNAVLLQQKHDDEAVLEFCFPQTQMEKDDNQCLPSTSAMQISTTHTSHSVITTLDVGGNSHVVTAGAVNSPVTESTPSTSNLPSALSEMTTQHLFQINAVSPATDTHTHVTESAPSASHLQITTNQSALSEMVTQNVCGSDNHAVTASTTIHNSATESIPSTLPVGPMSETVETKKDHAMTTDMHDIGPGWKIAFDNLDIFQKVREMTEDNQNRDHHWVNHVKVTNRVSGNHLPDEKPIHDSVMDLDNYKIIPTVPEHISQRGNYIILIERIITEEIPCLAFCKDVVTTHIPHHYSKEMSEKTEKECLGVIFHNENTTEGINQTLQQIHSYVPQHSSHGEAVFNRVGVVGDQLSVERAVNCLSSLANGFTPEERLDGLHVEIADWHTDMKFLALIYKRFYSTVSANDKCSLFADRNFINRRNVKADAHHAYAPNKQMFMLAFRARIVAAAMKLLGIKHLDSWPTAYKYPKDESRADKSMKKVYLQKLASHIIDKFVVDEKSYSIIVNNVLEDQAYQQARQSEKTPDGRFMCRQVGCNKTFRHDGQHRQNHERTAHSLIIERAPVESSSSSIEESDDVFNYQCNFMDHGLLYMNFTDAIAEGDGDRIMRCWKFLLLHFYSDSQSIKYAVEALYLQLQQQALLSPRQAFRQRWNRSVNNNGGRGKNVPLDLDVEHDNNSIKEGIRKLGPNLTHAAVTRCARMLPLARGTVHSVARECSLMKRSGKHFVKTSHHDFVKLVNQLVETDALTETPGRRYKHFKGFPRSPLRDLRMGKMCQWINKHKYELQIGRKAR